jgi:hypothetical protein
MDKQFTTRDFLRSLCEHGDNLAQTCRLALYGDLRIITEAWTAARKKEIVDRNLAKNQRLMDHVVLGDEWDLSLWKVPCQPDLDPRKYFFAAAINSGQHDPTDWKEQAVKYPGSKAGYPPVMSIIQVLQDWTDTFGKIAVGSAMPNKTEVYKKILAKHFSLGELDTTVPGAGFCVEPKEI